jgi:hypothetical protein
VDVLVRCEQLEADAQDLDGRVLLAATRGGQVALPDQRVLPSQPVVWASACTP